MQGNALHHARATATLSKRGFWSLTLSFPPTLFTFVNFAGYCCDTCINLLMITDFSIWGRRNLLLSLGSGCWAPVHHLPALTCPPPPGIPGPLHTAPAAHSTVLWWAQTARLAFASERYPWMPGMQKWNRSHAILQRLQADVGAEGHPWELPGPLENHPLGCSRLRWWRSFCKILQKCCCLWKTFENHPLCMEYLERPLFYGLNPVEITTGKEG